MNETILDFTGIVIGFHRVVTGLNGILYNGKKMVEGGS